MNAFKTGFASLLLSLLMLGSALAAEKVNINTADAAALEQVLVNVGAAKAQAIVEHRKAHGAFRSLDELATVKGIGLKTVERNRDRIELGSPAPRRAAASGATAATAAAPAR
ncbi:ComEA family DNA-binding protein [Luteimonas sp. RD2P54]|uniref:ComEA family DNA-binding protein n=1 Tax=Luteimonas endophytica TaxID=3042023 RepID=A0ABT6JB18_9GAMM|nr:ComEA family DNA-binding protein [Luteimonas endophytica]MDH5824025.1 ComEA family DNA-binding protein [Luteimonas endophytica]